MNRPAIGDHIEVYWPDDEQYYSGRVTAYTGVTGRHRIEYSDGDIELLDLRDELWRLVHRAPLPPPRAVTSQHLGAILRAAARPSRTVSMKKKRSSLMSPVSVLPPSPPALPSCTSCMHLDAPPARLLVAQRATRWLRDETRRPTSPVAPSMHALWVQICTDLCVRYVHDSLAIETRDVDDDGPTHLSNAEMGWLLHPCRGKSALRAVKRNYSAWKRPLTPDEKRIETDIMRAVARRFARAAVRVDQDDSLNSLQLAQSLAAAALQE